MSSLFGRELEYMSNESRFFYKTEVQAFFLSTGAKLMAEEAVMYDHTAASPPFHHSNIIYGTDV